MMIGLTVKVQGPEKKKKKNYKYIETYGRNFFLICFDITKLNKMNVQFSQTQKYVVSILKLTLITIDVYQICNYRQFMCVRGNGGNLDITLQGLVPGLRKNVGHNKNRNCFAIFYS